MTEIIVEPDEVWEYFFGSEVDYLGEIIAGTDEYGGVEILLSADRKTDMPEISVYVCGVCERVESLTTPEECAETVQEIYDEFLYGEVPECEAAEIIADREWELDAAVEDFVNSAAAKTVDLPQEAIDDIKDHFCEYIARKYGVEVHRPMWIEFDDGEKEFVTKPYSVMEFDDE